MSIQKNDDRLVSPEGKRLSTELLDNLSAEAVEFILTKMGERALDGEMTDSDRVVLYRLAMQVASDEFHRIEVERADGIVRPEALMFLRQIAVICEDEPDPEALMGV